MTGHCNESKFLIPYCVQSDFGENFPELVCLYVNFVRFYIYESMFILH